LDEFPKETSASWCSAGRLRGYIGCRILMQTD
jgi:hypothetical protein